MRRLPPFAELLAFEAVARHLSFTRAGAELCLTQSAVSHRVRRLEEHLGTQLIKRLNPGLALSDAGAAMLPELTAILDRLERLHGRRERRLRVAANGALSTWWLARRLASFMAQRPGLSIELVPIENDATAIPQVDVRILWLTEAQEGAIPTLVPLFREHVFPVCSPRLLQPKRASLRDPQMLATLPLLHKATHGVGEWSWQNWFTHLGIGERKRRGGELRFADMGLLLSAAADGAGVALARSLLAHDALAEGRLVVPLTDFEPMTSGKLHVARWRRDRADDPDIQAFVAWLVAEAKTTLEATEQMIRGPERKRIRARA